MLWPEGIFGPERQHSTLYIRPRKGSQQYSSHRYLKYFNCNPPAAAVMLTGSSQLEHLQISLIPFYIVHQTPAPSGCVYVCACVCMCVHVCVCVCYVCVMCVHVCVICICKSGNETDSERERLVEEGLYNRTSTHSSKEPWFTLWGTLLDNSKHTEWQALCNYRIWLKCSVCGCMHVNIACLCALHAGCSQVKEQVLPWCPTLHPFQLSPRRSGWSFHLVVVVGKSLASSGGMSPSLWKGG